MGISGSAGVAAGFRGHPLLLRSGRASVEPSRAKPSQAKLGWQRCGATAGKGRVGAERRRGDVRWGAGRASGRPLGRWRSPCGGVGMAAP